MYFIIFLPYIQHIYMKYAPVAIMFYKLFFSHVCDITIISIKPP